MELKTIITVDKKVAKALENLYNQMENMNWDYEIFADACFAIACGKNSFEFGLTEINIMYEGD